MQHQSYFYEIYFITSHSYECILLERGPLLVAWLTPASSIPNLQSETSAILANYLSRRYRDTCHFNSLKTVLLLVWREDSNALDPRIFSTDNIFEVQYRLVRIARKRTEFPPPLNMLTTVSDFGEEESLGSGVVDDGV